MAGDDFLAQTYDHAMQSYQAEMVEAQGDLLRAQANGDTYSAAEATRAMADIRARVQAYDAMAREHVASQRPPDRRAAVDLTPEEAMRVCGMDPRNPNDVNTYNAGCHRLQALKAKGMYRE